MSNVTVKSISVAKDFTRYPAGRFEADGPFSGERFRNEVLAPGLKDAEVIDVELDGVAGYGSSFLDEAFGGLVRLNVLSTKDAERRVRLRATDESLIDEIRSYMGSGP